MNQQNNNDNRNLILALVLMTAVWFGFSLLSPAKSPAPLEQSSPVVAVSAPAEALPAPAEVTPLTAPPATMAAPPREIVVETDHYRAVFSSIGARLIAFDLKNYRQEADPAAPRVALVPHASLREASLQTLASGGVALAEDAPFLVDGDQSRITLTGPAKEVLSFRHVTASGVEVVKSFTVHGDSYALDATIGLRNAGQLPLSGTLELSLTESWDAGKKDSYSFSGPALLLGDKLEQVDVDDLEKGAKSYGKETTWTSLQSKYFIMAAVPLAGAAEKVTIALEGGLLRNILQTPLLTLQVGERRQLDYLLFFGPKDPEQLKAAGHRLELAIDFGWFDLLAKPLFLVLTFFNSYLNNYGWSIILLTVILKLLFWPLTHKSYASMKSMQKLQPEMQKLRDKYKNDKERLNRELMELYKKHSVNPLGGCLPMLVQIPVFFALYKVLLDAIALRHAPFMLWITDLSAKDPYYITPLLMGASMFVQMKMTPASTDPLQAKIFTFMPVIFTFLFLNFPSGLVIYWLVNNLLTIAQQTYINRRLS
jgi:YidC/Oxa1 family membrane protein insertase